MSRSISTSGEVKMLTLDDMGEGGVQKGPKLDDVINEQPLIVRTKGSQTVRV